MGYSSCSTKQNDEIRLCVDMRRAIEAIIRERYPIPTVDKVLQSLNQSTVYSKLDLKWGYHQLELHPDSGSITKFTHYTLWSIPVQAPYVWDKLNSRSVRACH